MARFIIGVGLTVMLAAVAYFGVVTDDASLPVASSNHAATSAFWAFLGGTCVAIAGSLIHARR